MGKSWYFHKHCDQRLTEITVCQIDECLHSWPQISTFNTLCHSQVLIRFRLTATWWKMESERPDNKPVSRFPSSTNWLFPFMVNCNGLLAWLALPVALTEPQNSFTGKEVLDRLSCIFAEFPTKWTSDLIKRICVKSHSFDVDSFLVAFSQKVTRQTCILLSVIKCGLPHINIYKRFICVYLFVFLRISLILKFFSLNFSDYMTFEKFEDFMNFIDWFLGFRTLHRFHEFRGFRIFDRFHSLI